MSQRQVLGLTAQNEDYFFYQSFLSSTNDEDDKSGGKQAKLHRIITHILWNELSLPRKTAVILHHFEKLPQSEIAFLLGVHKSTISRNLKRAENQISKELYHVMNFL